MFQRDIMPRQIAITKVIDGVLDGFKESQKNYVAWSGGFWLWQAPEYLITVTVAKKINEIEGSKYITLEHGSTATLEDAGAKGRGRLPIDIREKGKVDILLWWGNDTPRAIIEIKNQISSRIQYEKDFKRIRKLLERNGEESSLQFGIFAFYDSAKNGPQKTAKEKISDKIDNIYRESKKIMGNNFAITLYKTDIVEEVKDNAWGAACILAKLK